MNLITVSTYHLIIYTEQQKQVITKPGDKILYKAIWEILKTKNCQLHRIGGTTDHVHMLIELSPIVAIGSIVKEIMASTEQFIRESKIFPDFENWDNTPLAFSTSFKDRDKLIEFIRDQPSYHEKNTTEQEKNLILKSHNALQ